MRAVDLKFINSIILNLQNKTTYAALNTEVVPGGDVGGGLDAGVDEEVEDPRGIHDWQPRRGQGVSGVDHLVCRRPKSLCEIRTTMTAAFFSDWFEITIHSISML